ncbi:MAG: hypothetical protein P4M12_02415 [Gammaproteobacteria bacterium]|nr:hypothetical protein [Gammaproteobacteria bacterium]
MTEKINYWESIIAEYKVSGLTQPAFCKQNGLSYNQFQYRWSQHNLAKLERAQPFILENNSITNAFESVCIKSAPVVVVEEADQVAELAIHLPNKIRCDIKMDLRNDAFATLLKQLVALC